MEIKPQESYHVPRKQPGKTEGAAPEGEQQNLQKGQQAVLNREFSGLEAETAMAIEAMAAEIAEKAGEAQSKKETKDRAQLSEESKGVEQTKKWDARAEQEAWQKLLKWLPSQGKTLSLQIGELKSAYMFLLEEILANVPKQQQAPYLSKLEKILLVQLDALLKKTAPQSIEFFSSYGSKNSLSKIKRAVYFAVTGRHLPAEKGKQLEAQPAGSLYSKEGKVKKAAEHTGSEAERLLYAAKYRQKGNTAYKANVYLPQMEKVQKFVKAMGGKESSLFMRPEFTSKNSALYGFLWAVETCKTQMFLLREPLEEPLRIEVETAVEQRIASWMERAESGQHRQKGLTLKREQAYEVYCYTMKQFYHGKKVNKAIRDGLYYALKYFLKERAEGELQNQELRSGFFGEWVEKEKQRQDLEKGMRALDENWKAFISQMGYEDELLQLTAGLYGIWAMFCRQEPEPEEKKRKRGEALAVAGGLAAAAVLLILGVVFF